LALGVALLHGSGAPVADGERTVRVLFTNNSNGKLTDCNCRNDPFGGLAERVSFVREYRSRRPDMLLLDSGGYFGLSDVDRKGPVVLKLMSLMGYDAWGVGDQELYRGLDRFTPFLGGSHGRVLSASIKTRSGEPAFTPYRIFTVDSVQVAVTGIVGPDTFAYFPKEAVDFSYDPPEEALARVLPALRESADYVIVLSQMGVKADEAIAAKLPGIDLIIGGHSQTLLEKELRILGSPTFALHKSGRLSGCRIVQAGKGGGRVGEVTVVFNGARRVKGFSYRLIEIGDAYTVPQDVRAILDSMK
jgi:2',3'-cyclic-nucleotide 2'-phosphodiesterase (5'-nucleotidase family)